jgi:hypothetical protein
MLYSQIQIWVWQSIEDLNTHEKYIETAET